MFTLKKTTENGSLLEAAFEAEGGLRLISFKREGIEVIDQKSQSSDEKRIEGVIGPHLYQEILNQIPWQIEQKENRFIGTLTGKDIWNDKPLSNWIGQNFKMLMNAELTSRGLILDLSIVSDTDSLIGFDVHYFLPQKKGVVQSEVKDFYYDPEIKLKKIPKEWDYSTLGLLTHSLDHECNYAFHSLKNPLKGSILLHTDDFTVATRYSCHCQENCWQLVHATESDYVSIKPMSAQNPWRTNLTVSGIQIELEILKSNE